MKKIQDKPNIHMLEENAVEDINHSSVTIKVLREMIQSAEKRNAKYTAPEIQGQIQPGDLVTLKYYSEKFVVE